MTPEERSDLLSRYLDENLEDGDEALLEKLLATDPEFARALVDLSLQHALLHRLARTGDVVPLEVSRSRRERAFARSPRSSPGILWAAAACIVAILGVVLYGLRPSPHPASPPQAHRPEPAPKPELPAPPDPKPEPRPVPPAPKLPDPTPVPPPVEERKPPEAPAPPPDPAPPAPVKEPVAPPPKTVTAIAVLERVEGPAFLIDDAQERRLTRAGIDLLPGQGIRTGSKASVLVAFPDGTRLELGAETVVRDVQDGHGKRLSLAQGTLSADVVKQPAGRPMVLVTPNAETTVVGTRFQLYGAPDSTRLDVKEGRVKLTRASDKASVDVIAGQFAVAAAGPAPVPKVSRSASGLLALYTFHEGHGNVVHDVSKTGSALDLRVKDATAVRWGASSLAIQAPTLLLSARPAAKIVETCKRTNELTVEAWIRPAGNAARAEPGRIVTLSEDLFNRNFTLEQGEPQGAGSVYNFRLRTTITKENGFPPAFKTPAGSAEPRLQHVVYTRASDGTASLYVDGERASEAITAGAFSTWDEKFLLLLGDEAVGQRAWTGEYHLLAIYGRALAGDEVKQHYRSGPD